jgi:hypothetical protein
LLEEAKAAGVIEMVEASLAAIAWHTDLRVNMNELRSAEEQILRTIAHIFMRQADVEQRLCDLERSRRVQQWALLANTIFGLIPLAGASVTCVIAGGAEVIDGLQIANIVESLLGAIVGVLPDAADPLHKLFNRFLSDGSDLLREERTAEENVLLKDVADQIGVSMSRLRQILQEAQRKMKMTMEDGDRERGGDPVEPADDAVTLVVPDDGSEEKGLESADPPAAILGGEYVVLATDLPGIRDSVADGGDSDVQQKGYVGSTLETGRDTEQAGPHAADIDSVDFARLKSLGLRRAVVVNVGQRELSMYLAAYLVMYESCRQLEYEDLQNSTLVGFRKNGVDGEALAGCDMLDSVEFVDVVWQQFGEDQLSKVGYKVKLLSFAAAIFESE